jgi:hypothetical protein
MGKFTAQCYIDPEYELVVMHPEHFLPNGSSLLVYDPMTQGHNHYVVARDRCLRASVDPNSGRFPPFHHNVKARVQYMHPNVFLVALNAETKFHRYLKMVHTKPPPTPLPTHVLSLMDRTLELIRLLYWWPVSAKSSSKEEGPSDEEGSSEEEGMDKEETDSWVCSRQAREKRRKRHANLDSLWKDMDVNARRAYGRDAMSGYGMLSFLNLCKFLTMVLCLFRSNLLQ